MNYIASNFSPIAAATLAGLVVGAVYVLLAHRSNAAPARRRWGLLLVSVIAESWLACILAGALILAPHAANPWMMAIGSAVVIWIGFVLPTLGVSSAFRGQRMTAVLGDVLHWLAVMVVQAVVLQAIGLVHP